MVTFDGSTDESWMIVSSDKARISMRGRLPSSKAETTSSITGMVSNSIWLSTSSEMSGGDVANTITCRGTSYLSQYFYIFVPPTMFTTIEELRAYLAETPLQIVYPLAEPITIPLTYIPELTTLPGVNNIWSDAGDVSVTYKADK